MPKIAEWQNVPFTILQSLIILVLVTKLPNRRTKIKQNV